MFEKPLLSMALVLLCSCSTEGAKPPSVSTGLKIFVSSRVHGGDFANDPALVGGNAIEKADAFCNSDPAKPSAATYKALLVDGVNRDAPTLLNWVLQPNTTYYRAYGDVVIGTTTSAAIFNAAYQALQNSIADRGPNPYIIPYIWTGIGDAANFSAGFDCSDWSTMTSGEAAVGESDQTSGWAFDVGGNSCSSGNQLSIYCVEQ